MLDFQQKWKMKSFMYSRWVRIVLGMVVLYSFYSTFQVYQKKIESERDIDTVQQNFFVLSAKEHELDTHIQSLQSPEGLESEIRSKYSVAKERERVAIIIENPHTATSTYDTHESIWSKVKHFFGF
jgi:cell division protein FtsB